MYNHSLEFALASDRTEHLRRGLPSAEAEAFSYFSAAFELPSLILMRDGTFVFEVYGWPTAEMSQFPVLSHWDGVWTLSGPSCLELASDAGKRLRLRRAELDDLYFVNSAGFCRRLSRRAPHPACALQFPLGRWNREGRAADVAN